MYICTLVPWCIHFYLYIFTTDAEPMQFLPEEFGDNSMGSTSMLQTQAPAPHLTPATTVSAMSTTHDINPTKLACYKWTSADVLKWLDKMSLTRFKEL